MIERKTTIRFFTPDQFDDEEKYLSSMSEQGWQFMKFSFIFYYFEWDKSVCYNYKLDYKRELTDMKNYKMIHEDCGWENIHEFRVGKGAWEYFRKETSLGNEHLFTDNESKIALLSRIRKFYMMILPIASIVLLANLLNMYNLMPHDHPFILFITVMYAFIYILYIKIFVRLYLKIRKLRKSYQIWD